jgi:hypothetical protein
VQIQTKFQVLRATLSPQAFANVCKRDWAGFKIQDSRLKILKKFLNPEGWIQDFKIEDFKKVLESRELNSRFKIQDLE